MGKLQQKRYSLFFLRHFSELNHIRKLIWSACFENIISLPRLYRKQQLYTIFEITTIRSKRKSPDNPFIPMYIIMSSEIRGKKHKTNWQK